MTIMLHAKIIFNEPKVKQRVKERILSEYKVDIFKETETSLILNLYSDFDIYEEEIEELFEKENVKEGVIHYYKYICTIYYRKA
ncbi:MAG: hypothetical protein QXX41_07910 [Nitrososphaerota archaeon]